MATMTLGPVIGKVTSRTARVLIEIDTAAEIVCTAEAPGKPKSTSKRKLTANRPAVFELSGLRPDTRYTIGFKGVTSPVPCTVRTYKADPTALNAAVVSCNFTVRRDDTDLWRNMLDQYVQPGHLDLLIHAGDQVYGDKAFEGALYVLNGKAKATAAQAREIGDLYRQLYRWAWRHPATRAVLASVPNLMIWDDHEIRDDWGSREEDRDPASPAATIGRIARRVYREYQRQLWEDGADADPPVGQLEDHMHAWGSVGVLFVDQRGARSFEIDPAYPYLGGAQWERVRAALGPGGTFAKVRALVVVTSVPLAYLGETVSTIGQNLVDDLRDHWVYGPHRKEQAEFLRALRRWKQEKNGEREVLVVGGDVHIGCHTEIKHEGQLIFRQLVTSPITNKPPSWLAFQGLKGCLEVEQTLGDGYAFEHDRYVRSRNFGIVLARVPAQGQPKIEGSLYAAG
jgi:hypothetical protein